MSISFSFIIVARNASECTPALDALKRLEWDSGEIETLISIGQNPSEQRNQAAAQARGEFLVFLDDDSRLHPKALFYFADALAYEPNIGAVGGPSVYDGKGSAFKTAVHAVFSSVFGLGPFRARYTPIGRVRATTERDLILCNLLVRKSLFLKEGGFRPELYPNEENEFLNRIGQHTKMYYHPLAICYREPRATYIQLARQLLSYGEGRAKHLLRFRQVWENIFFIPMLFVVYTLALLGLAAFAPKLLHLHNRASLWPLGLYLAFSVSAAALSAVGRKKAWLVFVLPPLFFSCHFFYGLGFGYGLLRALFPPVKPATAVEVRRIE